MIGWHHRLNGHEFEQATGDSDGGGSLACCSPWGLKELDAAERLRNVYTCICICVCVYVCMYMPNSDEGRDNKPGRTREL